MSDCIALAKLHLAGSRRHFTIAVVYWVVVHALAMLFHFGIGAEFERAPAVIGISLAYATLPLMISAFALFSVNQSNPFGISATSYSPWVLRTPVATWKLAAVPLVMRTLWAFLLCGSFAMTARMAGFPVQRWVLPAFGFSTLLATVCWLGWRPFRWKYSGLVILFLLCVPGYLWFTGSAVLMFDPLSETGLSGPFSNPRYLIASAWLIGIAVFSLVIWLSIRAVGLARANVSGLPSESPAWFSSRSDEPPTTLEIRSRPEVYPFTALLTFDLRHASGTGGKFCLAAWLSIVLLGSLANAVSLAGIIALGFVFMIVASFVTALFATNPEHSLPRLIATAPIASSKIVWTRQLTASIAWVAATFGGIGAILLIHWMRGTRFLGLPEWIDSMNSHYGLDNAASRIIAVVILVFFVLVIRQTTGASALLATGRPRYQLYCTTAKFLIGFVIVSALLFQFMKFPNWESWTAWALEQSRRIPSLIPFALSIKLACMIAATFALRRSELVPDHTIAKIHFAFIAIVALFGLISWQWIPHPNRSLWHCVAAAFILVPVSRILIAPVCLQSHRAK